MAARRFEAFDVKLGDTRRAMCEGPCLRSSFDFFSQLILSLRNLIRCLNELQGPWRSNRGANRTGLSFQLGGGGVDG